MLDFDVVIAGGGPAGAAAALSATRGGLRALLIEKQPMPRPKPCSGFLFSEALELLDRYFGEVPAEVRMFPEKIEGARLFLPKGLTLEVRIPGRNIARDRFDAWLCRQSGAEIWDGATLTDFCEWGDHVEVECLRQGERLKLSASVLVGADGNSSKIARRIDPSFTSGIPRFISRQDWWRARVDLEPGYLNVFCRAELGFYPSVYLKDDFLVMDSGVLAGNPIGPTRTRFIEFLSANHGLELIEPVMSLGIRAAFTAAYNRFCMGTGRVLLAGEAAGFQNVMGEGISSALATGYLAGQAISECGVSAPGSTYFSLSAPERERSAGEWRLTSMMTGRARPELRDALRSQPLPVRARVTREIFKWQREGSMMPAMSLAGMEVAARRFLHRGYDFRA